MVFNKLIALNFYTSTSTDLHEIQIGRWATRFYLVLFSTFMVILIFYSSLICNIETIIIQQPNLSHFLSLEMESLV